MKKIEIKIPIELSAARSIDLPSAEALKLFIEKALTRPIYERKLTKILYAAMEEGIRDIKAEEKDELLTSYELALELKEAGFPQLSIHGGAMNGQWVSSTGQEEVYIPTLSELLAWCGTEKIVLWKFEDLWHAGVYRFGSDIYIDDYPWPTEEGKDPEEAVTRLALELKKAD